MKKSLLALAVLASFAGVASAQTNVTVYGIVDMGLQRTDTNTTEPLWALDSGLQSGSRLGFKGTEDLGGGLSASFQLENGFKADDGTLGQSTATTTRLFGRQAWVGLNGGFGSVKLGRQNTPMYVAVGAVDPFELGLAGSLEKGTNFGTVNTFGSRMDNTVNYSLTAGAFSGQVAYGFGEVVGDTTASRQLGLSLGYANGPVNAVLAYHKQENPAGTLSDKTLFVGGTYNFGVVKAHASYADNKNETSANPKSRDYMLGISAPVGAAGSIMSSFQREKNRDSDAKFNEFAVGYTHNLSKRTNLYTSLGYSKLEVPSVADAKNNKFNVGIRHKF